MLLCDKNQRLLLLQETSVTAASLLVTLKKGDEAPEKSEKNSKSHSMLKIWKAGIYNKDA